MAQLQRVAEERARAIEKAAEERRLAAKAREGMRTAAAALKRAKKSRRAPRVITASRGRGT